MKAKDKDNRVDILKPLFWEYDWASVKENLCSPFVIARVLELGDPKQFRALTDQVGDETIKAFLVQKGNRLLSARSFSFWHLFYQRHEIIEGAQKSS